MPIWTVWRPRERLLWVLMGTSAATLEQSRVWFPDHEDSLLQECIDAGYFRIWDEDGSFVVEDLSGVLNLLGSRRKEAGNADTG